MIRAGIVGAGFAAELHADALARTGRARIVAVTSPSEARRSDFATRWGARPYPDIGSMLGSEKLDLVTVAAPNHVHAEATIRAAGAGAHVFVEKPLAMSLLEADRMIEACDAAGVHLFYGEELCFAPRYRRVRELIREGALGQIVQVLHRERHDGPHARWFYDPAMSGGGALLDMGCHGIEVTRWVLGKPRPVGVFAQVGRFAHPDAAVEDHAALIVRFEGGTLATIDGSWSIPGGVDERLEVVGTGGSVVADLARGSALLVYSATGYRYAAEKVATTQGWTFAAYDEIAAWGWVDQFAHVVDCLEGRVEPEETGRDGRVVLEIVAAAYESARTGAEVTLPIVPDARPPIDRWLGAEA